MKNKFYLLIVITMFLNACGGTTDALIKNESANGKVQITVEAKRNTSIEAWRVNIKVKAYNFKEGKLSFEIYANELNDKSVSFNWKDENHCSILFKQQDNTERKFELIASSEQLQLGEM